MYPDAAGPAAGARGVGRRAVRGGVVLGEPRVRGVQRPAPPGRVRALDLRPRVRGPLRRVRRGARRARRVGGVGAQPVGRRHGGRAGARRGALLLRRGRWHVVGRPDVQHIRVRVRGARAHRVPGFRPRRRARRRRPRQGLREARPRRRRLRWGRAEPGVAGRRRRLQRRRPRAARHGGRQPRRQDQAGPAQGDHRRRRSRQRHQEAQYPWSPERRELGRPAAHGRHLRQVPQDVPGGRPRVVLPPRHLPADRLHRGRLRLGHRHPTRQGVQGRHLHRSPQHRHRSLRSRHPSSSGAVPSAEEGAQVPRVLEHVPPLGGVHRHRAGHRQHLQGHEHPGRGAAVADRLHRRRLRAAHRRRHAGGRHVGRRLQAPQGREQDLQQRIQRPPAAFRVTVNVLCA